MSTPISRATFLKGLAGCSVAALGWKAYLEWTHPSPQFPCRMLGPSRKIGHLLRDPEAVKRDEVLSTANTKVTIVGGGMAGLSAAWWLRKHGLTDFVLLDLESDVGGNSASGKNEFGIYPWGAHYVPIANPESAYVRELFQELKIIQGHSEGGQPIYDELMLCHEPQERLYKDGSFHDGLVPKRGLQKKDSEDVARFFEMMSSFRSAKGGDGKLAFAIPLDLSSQDKEFIALDNISMAQWLKDNNLQTQPLLWYVNYCCRDDYGAILENVSAWAGIHYFAGRRGTAANSEPNAVITWPQGNGFLVEKLKEPLRDQIRINSLVTSVKQNGTKVMTTYLHTGTNEHKALESDFVIFAAPRFVAGRVIANSSANDPKLSYAPWMVANVSLKKLPEARGLAPAWDNVSYYSDSLGYVIASHQEITTRQKPGVITYYYPLSQNAPKISREKLYSSSPEQWSKNIVDDLEKMHPGIAREIISMDLWPWGHGMISPSVGFIWGEARRQMKKRNGNIVFAHSDMSGISNFEEAQYQGVEAAKIILQNKKDS